MKIVYIMVILLAFFAWGEWHELAGFPKSFNRDDRVAQLPGVMVIDSDTIPWKEGPGVTRIILGVDRDDNVRVYRWSEEKGVLDSSAEVERNLGQRIKESGGLPLSRLLPRKEVPVLSFRVTRGSSVRYHIIVTWGLAKHDYSSGRSTGRAVYKLYVIRENTRARQAEVVFTDRGGENLKQFLVADMGKNGRTEIVDVSLDGETELCTIRLLRPDGTLRTLQTFDGYRTKVEGEDYPSANGYFLRVEDKVYGCSKPPCITMKTYQWSPEKSEFIEWQQKEAKR